MVLDVEYPACVRVSFSVEGERAGGVPARFGD